MNEPQMTREQEALLSEAVEYSKIFEQQAKNLNQLGDALVSKWEEGLVDAPTVLNSKVQKHSLALGEHGLPRN